jgi:hypothetical protein
LGKTCEKGLGTFFDETGKNLCESFCIFANSLAPEEIRTIDKAYILHQDGYRKPVSIRIVPIEDDAGKIMGAVEILDDLSQSVFAKTTYK